MLISANASGNWFSLRRSVASAARSCLLLTSDSAFRSMIPVLLLVATMLLATQDRIRAVLHVGEPVPGTVAADPHWLVVPVLVVSF